MKIYILLITLLLITSKSNSADEKPLNDDSKFVTGIYEELLPTPVFYDAFVPIVYEYETPYWNKTEVTFNNWYSCITEQYPFSLSCPVSFVLNKAILNLHIDFNSLHPVTDTEQDTLDENDSQNEFYTKLFNSLHYCHEIQKHFRGPFIHRQQLMHYINSLERCPFGQEINRHVSKYNYGIRAPFSKIEHNFYNQFYQKIKNNTGNSTLHNDMNINAIAAAVLSNSRTAIQANMLSNFYAEKNRWVHALMACQNQVVPSSLLSIDDLEISVEKVGQLSNKMRLSIPAETISKYYSLPLTDCTHTNESFIVRILVPLLEKKIQNRKQEEVVGGETETHKPIIAEEKMLKKFTSVPFIYNKKICSLKIGGNSDTFLVNGDLNSIHETNCKPNALCRNDLKINSENQCLTAILEKNITKVVRICQFQCRDITEKIEGILPIVTMISSNKFVISGIFNQGEAHLSCASEHEVGEKEIAIEKVEFGAQEVQVPCGCTLVVKQKFYYPKGPCLINPEFDELKKIRTKQIIPWHFATEDIIKEATEEKLVEKGSNLIISFLIDYGKADWITMYDAKKIEDEFHPFGDIAKFSTENGKNQSDQSSRSGVSFWILVIVIFIMGICQLCLMVAIWTIWKNLDVLYKNGNKNQEMVVIKGDNDGSSNSTESPSMGRDRARLM